MFGTLLSKLITDEDILAITTKSISGVIWFALILGVLGTAGFDTKPILSIFGVAGITLGLSLQNLFSDLYAGLFVLFTRPFKRGSVVTISGHTGRVVSMDMRYVRLHNDSEKSDVLLPISLVYRNAVKVVGDGNGKRH
jgi:small-conductance mechanosensitive channel